MKLTIEQTKLANLINSPTSVVEAKNTIPILGHVKLAATQGQVEALATDLDIEAVALIDVDVTEVGECTVAAKPFEAIVKRLPKSALVTLEYNGTTLAINAGRSKFNLQTMPATDFPVMATNEYTHTAQIDAGVFLELLNKTKFAMSTEETRYYLNGVYLHNDEAGDLISVATDGHRLAKMTYSGSVDVAGVIIPRKTVDRLTKMLDGVDGDITLQTSDSKMRVSGDGFSITSKVVDGTFPDYTRVIPTSCKATMQVDAKEFSGAAGQVATIADARSRAVRLSVSGDTCSLYSHSALYGEAVSEVSVEYDGEPLDIGFNSVYTADFMSQAEGGIVSVGLGGSMDPALVRFDECAGFIGVLMPLRI
jgi:DNA polymerase-3 subunit beta